MRNLITVSILSLLSLGAFGATFIPLGTAPINYYGLPLLDKGDLVTSDGTANGYFDACADGEIIEWDATEDNGFKCVSPFTGVTPEIHVLGASVFAGSSWVTYASATMDIGASGILFTHTAGKFLTYDCDVRVLVGGVAGFTYLRGQGSGSTETDYSNSTITSGLTPASDVAIEVQLRRSDAGGNCAMLTDAVTIFRTY
jgi:hypothetical protein